ncbi:MAG: hypothetical protein IGS39_10795 [Calothrix sp. C42_A2020_038]|nr:hypothetical protein [Calothrix sp. C42_A2020_038]
MTPIKDWIISRITNRIEGNKKNKSKRSRYLEVSLAPGKFPHAKAHLQPIALAKKYSANNTTVKAKKKKNRIASQRILSIAKNILIEISPME